MVLQSDFELLVETRRDWLKRLREHDDPIKQDIVKGIIDSLEESMAKVKDKILEVI